MFICYFPWPKNTTKSFYVFSSIKFWNKRYCNTNITENRLNIFLKLHTKWKFILAVTKYCCILLANITKIAALLVEVKKYSAFNESCNDNFLKTVAFSCVSVVLVLRYIHGESIVRNNSQTVIRYIKMKRQCVCHPWVHFAKLFCNSVLQGRNGFFFLAPPAYFYIFQLAVFFFLHLLQSISR